MGEWLRLLGLEEYYACLDPEYNIDSVVDVTWEDLEEIGVAKLGQLKTFAYMSV